MIDWKQRHLDIAHKERRAILIPDATQEQATLAGKQRQVPAGSIWLWAVGMLGPKNSAVQPDRRTGED